MSTLIDSYTGAFEIIGSVYGANWVGQGFTASQAYTITSAKIGVGKVGSPGTCTLSVYTTASGKPDSLIATGTFDGNGVADSSLNEQEVVFDSPVALSNGVVYSLVLSVSGINNSNKLTWYGLLGYAGGAAYLSTDSGSTWGGSPLSVDFWFETYDDTVNVEMSATVQGSSGISADLTIEGVIEMVATLAGVGAISADLYLSVLQEKYYAKKRIVGVGNDQFWYEDL